MEEHQHPINDFASLDAISLEGPSPFTEYGFLGEPSIMTLEANSSELKSKRDSSNLCEEDLKQIKRAQNRAAQRAFRERKEARLRALEQDLQQSEQHRKALAQELEELRKENLELSSKEKLMLEDEALQTLESDGTTFSFPAEYENHHHELLHQTRQYHDNFMKEQRSYHKCHLGLFTQALRKTRLEYSCRPQTTGGERSMSWIWSSLPESRDRPYCATAVFTD